jgi:hypothetical protein
MDVIEPAPLTGPAAPRLNPDSSLVIAAFDLLARHTADQAESTCQYCGEGYPCPTGIHAALVCRAAGLDLESIGLPAEAFRWELAG